MTSTSDAAPYDASPQSVGNFDLVRRIKLDFTDVEVSKWWSRKSGLRVVHLDYEAPIVNAYFVIPTEIFNDSGCPHTLEHLVFMGSQKFPHKGIIDHLANRGFSNGTNAWTDTDHTAYTVSTAGDQGFLQLLPIYLDHILYPTMTCAGFVTEVHHIDPKGQDSGVVYSEMQGRQNSSGDLMHLRCQQLVNPSDSAYRSETGGLMEALRVLTIEKIREYHSSYYLPHNLTLIVAGKLMAGTRGLLSVLQEQVEPSIAEHGQARGPKPAGWKRPFVETESANRSLFKESIQATVTFPEKDESMGELVLHFMGPPPNDFRERKALDIIGTYLTSSAVAPLTKEYVETDRPLCTYIYFSEDVRANRVDLPIYIGSVPTEHIDDFEQRLKTSLLRVVEQGIDMERMSMVINRDERQLRSKLESSKGDTFSMTVIDDVLYGPEDASELEASMNEFVQYSELRNWTSTQWTAVLQKWFIDNHCVVVRGKPSASMADKLESDEKARIAEQVKDLGPEGLEQRAEDLAKAKEEHDRPIPQDILTSFPVPDVQSIAWIPVQSVQEPGSGREVAASPSVATELSNHLEADGPIPTFFVQYDHVKSDFVTVHAFFSLADLKQHLRPYVSTFLSALFSSPVNRGSGETLNHEQVINRLDDETVSYEASLGMSSAFTELLRISLKVERHQYENAVTWIKDIIYGSQFTKDRLAVTVAKIRQSLPEMKRDGTTVLSSFTADVLYADTSTSKAAALLAQIDFIPELTEKLEENPDEVIKVFEELRTSLIQPSNVRFSVAGDILSLPRPRAIWREQFSQDLPISRLAPVPLVSQTLSELGQNPAKKAEVISLPTIESSYVCHTTRGMHGFSNPDHAAMRIALEVMNATESFLWRYIRGSGLAYGAYVSNEHESGLLSFSLYRSSNPIEGFHQAAKVVRGIVDGSIPFEDTGLDAAKSSLVFSITKGVSSPGRAAAASFLNQALKGVSQNHSQELLEKVQATTKEDVISTLRTYFLPLFDPEASIATVVTAPGNADEIAQGLGELGFDVTKRTLEVEADEYESGSDSGSGSEHSSSEDSRA